ncbi:MAG: NAD(P)-binding domain-containing protein [Actinomycetia bacterium]|nr:NAD(P)-binding domain-containing protein [Actinomycetes bacterium]
MKKQASVCVVGAGLSGLTSIKKLLDQGHTVTCFEIGSDLGGNWRYDNDNGRSAAYASLHIDTSKKRFEFEDFPAPKQWDPYLHHTQVLEYLESYAETFELRHTIRFRHKVMSIRRDDDRWLVEVTDIDSGGSSSDVYDAVVVASGHHWDMNMPEHQGDFEGEVLHAQDYRTPDRFIGKNVVVVGLGNTGADIACELSWHATAVTLAARSGAHVLPRYVLGRPLDTLSSRTSSKLPLAVQRVLYRSLLAVTRGSQTSYGVPTPDGPLLSEHPTVSQDLLRLVKDGQITVLGDVSRFTETDVVFVNGESVPADVVIYATGYNISFPFLPEELIEVRDNRVDLYNMVVPVDLPGLYFVGLIQPVGALPPLAEQQARWVAQLVGGAPIPSAGEMRAEIVVATFARQQQYLDRPRHTIQVDYWPYLDHIRQLADFNEPQHGAGMPPIV